MSQSNDGSNSSHKYDPRVLHRDVELQNHEQNKLYMPLPGVPYTAEFYKDILAITEQEIEKLTIEDCNKYEMLLSGYAFFIKRAANIENSRILFLKHQINKIISQIHVDGRASWETQRYKAINENVAAQKFNEDLIMAEQKYARLEDLHFGINNIADKYKSIKYSKQQSMKNEQLL